MLVYIAGPMRKIQWYNFPAFDAAADKLRAEGHEAINPAELDRKAGFDAMKLDENYDWDSIPDEMDFDLAKWVQRDIAGVLEADAIYMLEGWEDSTGATVELAVAKFAQKVIRYQTERKEVTAYETAVDPDAEVRVVDEKTGGEKGSKVARFDLLPPDVMFDLAEHYGKNCIEHGGKYEARNWEKGYDWGLSFAALGRHLNAFKRGEDIDVDSGSSHMVSAAWHCLAVAAFLKRGIGTDDRVKL